MRPIILARTFTERLDGPINETVAVRFRDGDGKRRELDLARALPEGADVVFGNLPIGPVWLKHRAIGDDIGYIAFNVFMDPVNLMPNFAKAVESYRDRDGIVLDLRGNRGGIAAMAMGLAGWFISEPNTYLGTMYMRNAELQMVVNPRIGAYDGPVAVLVDGCSASCAEIFAGGLRDLGRARIFGTPTAGAALPAAVERLPNGDGFMYPVADYISRNGDRFEGEGVVPDVEAGYTRAALLDGRDLALEAATEWIRASARSGEAGG
jgi:carboxyl-terminal processing protease